MKGKLLALMAKHEVNKGVEMLKLFKQTWQQLAKHAERSNIQSAIYLRQHSSPLLCGEARFLDSHT